MAMIDYGAIAFKNGKLISTDMFTPMIDMVGWEDTEADMYHDFARDTYESLKLKGNYFAYVGDADVTVGFYKCGLCVVDRFKNEFWRKEEWFSNYPYIWTKWRSWFAPGGEMKVTKHNGYYIFKWKYKGDKYKVYFGYGVDFGCYEKYRIVNYYRSPMYLVRKIPREIKNKIWDWRHGY